MHPRLASLKAWFSNKTPRRGVGIISRRPRNRNAPPHLSLVLRSLWPIFLDRWNHPPVAWASSVVRVSIPHCNPGISVNVPASDSKQDAKSKSDDAADAKQADDLPEEEPLTPELVEDEAIRGDFMMRWAAILLAFLLGCTDIFETDTLVHIKSGQHTLSNFFPATTDIYSSSAEGRSWNNLSWLFDALLAGFYNLGELAGNGGVAISFFKAVIAAVTIGVLVHTNRKDSPTWWGTICAVIALLACHRQFTARPEIVTLLGVALTVRWIHLWKENGDPKSIKWLAILFLVWANSDPRMFLGLAILLLYAVGETLGDWLGFPGLSDDSRRRKLWMAVGVSVAVTLINPFLWNALLAPISLYSAEYPTLSEIYNRNLRGYEQIQYHGLLDGKIWTPELLTLSVGAGLLMLVTAVVTFVLNYKRLDFGHVFVLLGFTAFSMVAVHELAAAAIVAAGLAALNAQQWYQHSFRQTYSVETSELFFSRGGRAVTVFTFFGIAYLAISGVSLLDMKFARRTGVGLHPDLTASIEGLESELEDSYDDRPFNFVLTQGDLLIWIDKRPFIDSRIGLYAGGEVDLALLHDTTRREITSADPDVEYGTGWKETLDQYQITHILPRLDSRLTRSLPAYHHFLRLFILHGREWQLSRFGPTSAVFYRRELATDSENREWAPRKKYADYLQNHRFDFIKRAFRTSWDLPEIRPTWPEAPTTYARFLSRPQRRTPNAVEEARHYLAAVQQLMAVNAQGVAADAQLQLIVSAAYLAIRKADKGLNDDIVPHHVMAYRVLGKTYLLLMQAEQGVIQMRIRPGNINGYVLDEIRLRRTRQAILALNQALILEPDDLATWRDLASAYRLARQQELALNAYKKAIELASRDGIPEEKNARTAYDADVAAKDKLESLLELPLKQIAKFRGNIPSGDAGRNQRMQLAALCVQLRMQQSAQPIGLAKTAMEIVEEDLKVIEADPRAALLWVRLLQLNGRAKEAFEEIQRLKLDKLQLPAAMVQEQQNLLAYSELSRGNYLKPEKIWEQAADRMQAMNFQTILDSVPLSMHSAPLAFREIEQQGFGNSQKGLWLVNQLPMLQGSLQPQSPNVVTTCTYLYQAGVTNLESGKLKDAERQFKQILEIAPDGPLTPVASLYLTMLTGKPVVPPNPDDNGKRKPVEAPRPKKR